MPGTIETDGPGAPAPPQPGPSRRPQELRATATLTTGWDRLRHAPARAGLTVAATIVIWAASAVTWSLLCLHVDRTDAGLGWDLVTSWRAAVAFAHGVQPYSLANTHHRLFLYPPSSLILLRPMAVLSLHQVQIFGLVATAVITWASVMITAAALGRRWWGLTAAVVVFALRFAEPLVAELGLANVTVVCMLAMAAFFLFTKNDHWVASGVAIGLTLSVKPLLLPVLLVFVLARRWRGLAVSIAIPAVLNAVAFAVVADPSAVFSKLPSLLNRSGSGVFYNSAWVDVMRSFGAPDAVTILLRLLTVVLVVVAAWWSWRQLADQVLRVITTTSVLLIGAYLAGTLSENHFMLTLVPLAMTVIVPTSPMRWPTSWVGILLCMGVTPPGSLLGLNAPANYSVYRALGMSLLVLTVLAALGYRRIVARRPRASATSSGAPVAAEPVEGVTPPGPLEGVLAR